MKTPEEWQKKVRSNFEPSSYQCDIFQWIANGSGNAVVEAVAGSGKSTTIVLGARLILGFGVYIAFSKPVVEEIKPKLSGTNMEPRTVHSIGYGAIRFNNRGTDIRVEGNGSYKYRDRIKMLEAKIDKTGTLLGRALSKDELKALKGKGRKARLPAAIILDLFSKARLNLIDFEGKDYPRILWGIANHHNTEIPEVVDLIVLDVIKYLAVWGRTNISIIDFTDMVWLPVVNNWTPKRWMWVFVDECQDISPAQLALIKKCIRSGGRSLWVGDRCQPAGTMISIPENQNVHEFHSKPSITQVPIESLKKGMKVVSCDMRSSAFIQNGKEILGFTKREFVGELIHLESEGKNTRYTPNHKCIAKFSSLRNKYCVYMMAKGNSYRIGKCKLDYGTSSGPAARARAEGAERLWILEIFNSSKEASVWEQAISGKFGISQLVFERNCKAVNLKEKELKEAWNFIGDKTEEATLCLQYFGRNWLYPLFDFTSFNKTKQNSLKRPMVVHACNLIDGVEVLHYENKCHYKATQWRKAKVYRKWYKGPVYSMDVEKYELYVADGILTHNCQAIFGFAGADAKSFQQIIVDMKAKIIPLSVCYRCPTSGIKIAKKWVPQMEAAPNAKEGTVSEIDFEAMLNITKKKDMILSRKNAPLVGTAFELISKGKSAVVKGKAIGEGLVKIVEKIARKSLFSEFGEELSKWAIQEKEALEKRGGDKASIQQKSIMIDDTAECIRIVLQRKETTSIQVLMKSISDLFSDTNGSITLSSIHRAKGLENDRIFILGPTEIYFKGQRGWQKKQESNLSYVAHTRHKQDLFLVKDKPKEK